MFTLSQRLRILTIVQRDYAHRKLVKFHATKCADGAVIASFEFQDAYWVMNTYVSVIIGKLGGIHLFSEI